MRLHSQNHQSPRLLRIAVVEPSDADARWFELALRETLIPATILRYKTEISALEAWSERLASDLVIDLVVFPAVLPMLTSSEFVDRVRAAMPGVPLAALSERFGSYPVPVDVKTFEKPVSPHSLLRMMTDTDRRASGSTSKAA